MERVFRALADPARRAILDRLRECDGQTLGELCRGMAMTRFGVMKHLRVLAAASLVVTRRAGRSKLHYLNPVPIREVHDRWIGKYAESWTSALGALKRDLEEATMANTKPKHIYEVYIRTTPEALWEAITSPELTRRYFHDTAVESDWKVGSAVVHRLASGESALEGEILVIDPPRRLVTTFRMVHNPDAGNDPPSRVTWEIERRGETCKLTLVHDQFEGETRTYQEVGPGWNPILSGLKTLLETGVPLRIDPSPGA